jgi:hypothetical protein
MLNINIVNKFSYPNNTAAQDERGFQMKFFDGGAQIAAQKSLLNTLISHINFIFHIFVCKYLLGEKILLGYSQVIPTSRYSDQ